MKKNLMAVLLACALAVGTVIIPFGGETVWAEGSDWQTEGDWEYYINGDSITIRRYTGSGTEVTIPESLGGKEVTEIGEGAFSSCNSLISVNIPNSVTTIRNSAFSSCSNLTSINIPDSVTTIGDGTIGEGVFEYCSSLTSINIPNSVTEIKGWTFMCSGLTSINIPNSVTVIGAQAFSECSSLTSVNIPDSVTQIGYWAFWRCTSLSSINIPDSVKSIGDMAFRFCSSLTSINISNSMTKIDKETFGECSSLTSINIPDSVKTIEVYNFYGCNKLKDVYYGGSKEQWDKIDIKRGNDKLTSANIHYNGSKSAQTITAKNITKTYGAKAFSLNAKSSAGAALSYAVSNKKIATVDKKGKVTIRGCGITNITIKAAKKGSYGAAQKTVKLTVKPRTVTLSTAKSTKKKMANVKWKKNKEAQGYIIQCATDSKFKKNKVQTTINKGATASATVKKLKSGKKYYIRVCAYAKSGKTKVQGDWSKIKTVKVK